jgi:hypothetical protein
MMNSTTELQTELEQIEAEIEQKRNALRNGDVGVGVVSHISELQTKRDRLLARLDAADDSMRSQSIDWDEHSFDPMSDEVDVV